MRKIGTLFIFLALICCVISANALTILKEMDYIVGVELEAGEYILFSMPGKTGYFHLASDLYDSRTIAEEEFETNTFLTVRKGEYLVIRNCIGVRAEEFYAEMKIGSGQFGAMLKIGYDLEPGKYVLDVAPGKAGQCGIFISSRHSVEDLMEAFPVESLSEIEVSYGQYLLLTDCRIVGGSDIPTVDLLLLRADAENGARIVAIQEGKNPAIYSIPSTKGEKISQAKAGMLYKLLDTDTRWYKIRMEDGREGWIVNYYAEIID